jgi:hypothetical protein
MVRRRPSAGNGMLDGAIEPAPMTAGSKTRLDSFAEFAKNVLYQMDTANAH